MQVSLLPPRDPSLCNPITANRSLGDCHIANVPLRDLLATELRRAGFEIIDNAAICPRTVCLPIDTWVELGALLMLARSQTANCLSDADGRLLAWKGSMAPPVCAERLTTEAESFPILYPWDLLRINEEVLSVMDDSSIQGEVSKLASITGHVRIGPGTTILPGTVIEGPVVIGPNCHIGPNAYIRGATAIGTHCFVGNGAEVKNSIIYNSSYISRQCYVGDSIIGTHVTLGAGTCTENHRHDGRHHFSLVRGQSINTGRMKLGAIIGDGVHTGVNVSIEAAIKIGVARTIKPGTYVQRDLL